MNPESNLSERFILEDPHVFERDLKEAKIEFWEFARARVHLDSHEEHTAFHDEYFPQDVVPTSAAFVLESGQSLDEDSEKGLMSFDISINKDFFGKEYADLIPYAIEHEIYEAWLRSKRGFHPSAHQAHLLARMHQVRLAMKDGKVERLIEFYGNTLPEVKEEFVEAHKRVIQEREKDLKDEPL